MNEQYLNEVSKTMICTNHYEFRRLFTFTVCFQPNVSERPRIIATIIKRGNKKGRINNITGSPENTNKIYISYILNGLYSGVSQPIPVDSGNLANSDNEPT